MPLHILSHPLAAHIITHLRDQTTKPATFRTLAYQISLLLAIEATRAIATEEKQIATPLETITSRVLHPQPLVVVPILRAGLGMVEGILRLMPSARVGHIGLYRDHETLEPVDYYFKVPGDVGARDFLLLDPMLATGGSLTHTAELLVRRGVDTTILVVCVLAAPEGLQRLEESGLDLHVITAAVDERLDERRFIVPGLGDAGDRLYGTV